MELCLKISGRSVFGGGVLVALNARLAAVDTHWWEGGDDGGF
jgi:hypothetical protein